MCHRVSPLRSFASGLRITGLPAAVLAAWGITENGQMLAPRPSGSAGVQSPGFVADRRRRRGDQERSEPEGDAQWAIRGVAVAACDQ